MRMDRRLLASLAAALFVAACTTTSEDDRAEAGDEEIRSSGITARANDPCVATLVFLQKDAYVSTGRSNDLWPPHTTTVLEVACQTAKGEQRIAPFKENYGTKPGTKDSKGNLVLVQAETDPDVVTTRAPWREMRKLVESYESCGCDPKGFLGLDTIDVEGKGLLESIAPILDCPGSNDALLGALKEKRFAEAKTLVARCRVREDISPAELARAATDIEREVKELYADHHLCNNNALLQSDLFARFRDERDAAACNPHDAKLCYGPKLFFNPAKEAR